jgi:hypothetical protein
MLSTKVDTASVPKGSVVDHCMLYESLEPSDAELDQLAFKPFGNVILYVFQCL